MAQRRNLHENEITSALQNDSASEDGLDFDDDSLADPDFDPDFGEFIEESLGADFDMTGLLDDLDDNDRNSTSDVEVPTSSNSDPAGTSGPAAKRQKLSLRWKKKNLELNAQQLAFTGNESLGSTILDLETPIQFFLYLFPQELIKKIADETNLYLVQKDPNNTFRVTEADIRQFIGLVYIMSLIQLPRVTNHWSSVLGTPLIQHTMPSNKFEKIRQYMHFNDNSKCLPRTHPDADRLFKIHPVVDTLNEAYAKVPLETRLCVDEQICSTKARCMLKRYNPKKPHKWGYKLYVLSGVSGFAYTTEVETGKENVVRADEPDLGASSNIVISSSPRSNRALASMGGKKNPLQVSQVNWIHSYSM